MSSLRAPQYVSVFDAIPYFGGSKVASRTYLKQISCKKVDIKIFTQDKKSWSNNGFSTSTFRELSVLKNKEYGCGFYAKNAILALRYLAHILFLVIKNRQRPNAIIGISGPGVDAAMYLAAKIFNVRIIQLIHGPVGDSRLSKKLLITADLVGCLSSEYQKIVQSIGTDIQSTDNIKERIKTKRICEFKNGIDSNSWPSTSHSGFIYPEVFWAASLLKWKRLDLFQNAFSHASKKHTMRAIIAYISPTDTLHSLCKKPTSGPDIEAVESPIDIDKYRAQCNIFVSTSESEPFGLSILEALSAGLCVVIPSDGAYWDKELKHGYDCIKYKPNCSESLSKSLIDLAENMSLAKTVARNGIAISKSYKAENTYKALVSESLAHTSCDFSEED